MARPKKEVVKLTEEPKFLEVETPKFRYPSIRSEWIKEITTELVKISVEKGKRPTIEVINEAAEAAETIVQRTLFYEE